MLQDESAALHRLVLVRHAKSDYPPGVADHDRPLNARGARDAPFIGSWIRMNVPWPPDGAVLALVSTAYRAQSTWALARKGFDDEWRTCHMVDEPRIYEASAEALRHVVAGLPEHVGTAVLVGHNPGLLDLVYTSCLESEEFLRAIVKFPTSSIAVLETRGPWADVADGGREFALTQFAVARAQPN